MHGYLSGICKNQNSPAIIVGGAEDHVHLLCRLGKTIDIAKLVLNLKKDSSEWAKAELGLSNFYWQTGYGAFSVSPAHVEALTRYIANQEEHHRKESFKDEFRRLCAKYGVEIDERYVWD
jgi:REP element-mobilizing transposase RayT